MAKRSVVNGQGILDPMFHIPEGLNEFTYINPDDYLIDTVSDEESSSDPYAYEVTDDVDAEDDSFIVEDDIDYYERPASIDELTVVQQIIRTQPDGSQVVDVIVEVEDIPGVSVYDFRVVPA